MGDEVPTLGRSLQKQLGKLMRVHSEGRRVILCFQSPYKVQCSWRLKRRSLWLDGQTHPTSRPTC